MKQPKQVPMVQRLKARLAANPKINLIDMSIPLGDGSETPKLKDILEENVDEKYYLKHSVVQKIIEETDFKERLVSITINKKDNE